MHNYILSIAFALLGIRATFKMKKAKQDKNLFDMLDNMCTSILCYLAMMLTILMR